MAEASNLPVFVEVIAGNLHSPHDFHLLDICNSLLLGGRGFSGDIVPIQLEGFHLGLNKCGYTRVILIALKVALMGLRYIIS